MADTDEVPENRLPRSKKDKKKPKYRSMNKIVESDGFRINPDLGFNGGTGHSVYGRHGLHRSHLDYLKSFGPQLEKRKDELIDLLSSTMKDEKLRMILINQYYSSSELYTCIGQIALSIGVVDMPAELPPDEEAEEALLKQPVFTTENRVLADTSAVSEISGGSESGLKALIKNLKKQMGCITELIHFLEVDGSTKDEMYLVIMRLVDLLENEKERNMPFVGREVYRGD